MGSIHAAVVERSARLRGILTVLRRRKQGATTAELQAATDSMSPATDVSELRARRWDIRCTYEGRSASGRKVYRYRLRRRGRS